MGVLLVGAGGPSVEAAAPAEQVAVSVPHLEGPVKGGIKTGRPWYASLEDPASFGYVEEEFFVSGGADEPPTPFKTRMHVLRPDEPARFNGSVVVEWANVSAGFDTYPMWSTSWEHIVREGFAYVAVSVQKAGVDALLMWDPVRYPDLSHPGDAFDLDIFSQAATALRTQRAGDPDPLGRLATRNPGASSPRKPPARLELIATGASQSGGRLRTYLRDVQPKTGVFDGFVPLVVGRQFPTGVAPTLIVNSEYEENPPPPDGKDLVVWEVAGSPHVAYREFAHDSSVLSRELSSAGGTTSAPPIFTTLDTHQYGERGPGGCPAYMPVHYARNAALTRMHEWLRTGRQPAPAPRYERDATGRLLRDQHFNVRGGVRLPPITVPIATYDGSGQACDLFGATIPFDPLELAQRYPTHESYVKQMRKATRSATATGYLVAADAVELMARAEASSVGRKLPLP